MEGADKGCATQALLGQAQELAHFRLELKPVPIRRGGGGGTACGGLRRFDLWLKSQLPLWSLWLPLSSWGLLCVVALPCPLLCGNLSLS